MPREWNATSYDSLPLPHQLQRWPGIDLVLLDGSEAMLELARNKLGEAVEYVQADLDWPLPIAPVGRSHERCDVPLDYWSPGPFRESCGSHASWRPTCQ